MMTTRTLAAVVLAAALALPPVRALAAEPNLSDIAGCNEEAAAKTGPSASPRLAGPSTRPPAAGAPIIEGERDLPRRGGSEKSDPSGSIVTDTADPLAKGMDAQRADDPAYRAAYRDCMKARSGRSR